MFNLNTTQRNLSDTSMVTDALLMCEDIQAFNDDISEKFDFPELTEKPYKKSRRKFNFYDLSVQHNYGKSKRAAKLDRDVKEKRFQRKELKKQKASKDAVRCQLAKTRRDLADIKKAKETILALIGNEPHTDIEEICILISAYEYYETIYLDEPSSYILTIKVILASLLERKLKIMDLQCNYSILCSLENDCKLEELRLSNPSKKDMSFKSLTKREEKYLNRYYYEGT